MVKHYYKFISVQIFLCYGNTDILISFNNFIMPEKLLNY